MYIFIDNITFKAFYNWGGNTIKINCGLPLLLLFRSLFKKYIIKIFCVETNEAWEVTSGEKLEGTIMWMYHFFPLMHKVRH